MFIPDHQIDAIRNANDIVDIVSDHVRLRQRGTNYVGLCPFHNEKTPSFSVNPGMGIFKCFGCGKGGNVFQFLMEIESLTFPEAARTLAARAGITLETKPADEAHAREVESVHEVLRFAGRFFHECLRSTAGGRDALAYVAERGFTSDTIRRFGIGWAPDRWDALLVEAAGRHISADALKAAGLAVERQGGDGCYDRFRGRVTFPIFSTLGKVIGFGGRTLTSDPDTPKYINSPETSVYNKSRALYGLFQGKSAIRREEEAVLVEGYTDVLALHQAGIENAVACSGTALTVEQVRILGRFAKRILLLYDADEAGMKAALRSIDLVLSEGLSAYVVSLPTGEDPDSYVRTHGADAFHVYAKKRREGFVAFTHSAARRNGSLATPEGEHAAMQAVLAATARIPEPLRREPYLKRTSRLFGVPESTLRAALSRLLRGSGRTRSRAPIKAEDAAPRPPSADVPVAEKALLHLMLSRGVSMVEYVMPRMSLQEFTEGPSRDVATRLLEMYHRGNVDASQFLAGERSDAVQRLVVELLAARDEPSQNWAAKNVHVPGIHDKAQRIATDAMKQLKLRRIGSMIEEIVRKMKGAPEDAEAMQRKVMQLHAARREIQRGVSLS